MSTMKGNLRRTILSGVVGALCALGVVGTAGADVASDKAAAILIYPKIVVDTSGVLTNGAGTSTTTACTAPPCAGARVNTEIQMTNTSNSVIAARCFLVNANSHCRNGHSTNVNNPQAVCTAESEAPGSTNRQCDPFVQCVPQWSETDFKMTLTKRQPVSWTVLDGLASFPLDPTTDQSHSSGNGGQSNAGSFVPPVKEDPFFGSITCVEVDPGTFTPVSGFNPSNNAAGDLKGETTIVSVDDDSDVVDARKYNAVGLQSTIASGGSGPNADDTLIIGGPNAEYTGCPNVLIMDHLFDGAEVQTHTVNGKPTTSAFVSTDLTIVPCGQDFNLQVPNTTLLQLLVFNEFEQRFSTSTRVNCFKEIRLSDIDTAAGPTGDAQSIFNVGVEGTLAGQTRLRSVENSTTANGAVGIIESFWTYSTGIIHRDSPSSAAANLHFTGTHINPDVIVIPQDVGP